MTDVLTGFFIFLLIVLMVFWFWMLYDAWVYTTKKPGASFIARYFWVIVVFFGSFIGMFIYYFMKKRNRSPEERSEYDRIIGR